MRLEKQQGFKNKAHKAKWKRTIHVHAKPLHKKRIDLVTTEDVLDVLRPIWLKTPAAAKDAAHASHPEWVIRLAMHQANSIMDTNQAGHYARAAQWLETTALAHEVQGREDDWRACLDELIERHRRKYKLRPLLEELRGR